jgi:hypothetical protein
MEKKKIKKEVTVSCPERHTQKKKKTKTRAVAPAWPPPLASSSSPAIFPPVRYSALDLDEREVASYHGMKETFGLRRWRRNVRRDCRDQRVVVLMLVVRLVVRLLLGFVRGLILAFALVPVVTLLSIGTSNRLCLQDQKRVLLLETLNAITPWPSRDMQRA